MVTTGWFSPCSRDGGVPWEWSSLSGPAEGTLLYQTLGHPTRRWGAGWLPQTLPALSNLCWTEHPEIWGFRGNKHSGGNLKDSVMAITASIVIFWWRETFDSLFLVISFPWPNVSQICRPVCFLLTAMWGSSVCGIFQASIPEWVGISCSRGSSWPRDPTCISCVSCIAGRLFIHWAIGEAPDVVDNGLYLCQIWTWSLKAWMWEKKM